MSKTRSVLVVKPLVYQGRSYVRGDRVDMTPTHALAHQRKGHITLTHGVNIPKVVLPEPPRRRGRPRKHPEQPSRERQTYQTRDMIADPVE